MYSLEDLEEALLDLRELLNMIPEEKSTLQQDIYLYNAIKSIDYIISEITAPTV